MKFQITEDWPLHGGVWLCPAGTVIDTSSNDQWSMRAKGLTPPLSAVAMDQEAFDAQLREYPDAAHLLGGAWR